MAEPFVIELSSGSSQNVHFQPLQKILRGRHDTADLPKGYQSASPRFWDLDVVPGLYLSLDVERKIARVIDPIADDPELRRSIGDWRRRNGQASGDTIASTDHATYADLDDITVATWAHWMTELVKRGKATVVSGSLPKHIKDSGRAIVNSSYKGHTEARTKDEMAEYKKDPWGFIRNRELPANLVGSDA